jgi:hypothetical protein
VISLHFVISTTNPPKTTNKKVLVDEHVDIETFESKNNNKCDLFFLFPYVLPTNYDIVQTIAEFLDEFPDLTIKFVFLDDQDLNHFPKRVSYESTELFLEIELEKVVARSTADYKEEEKDDEDGNKEVGKYLNKISWNNCYT